MFGDLQRARGFALTALVVLLLAGTLRIVHGLELSRSPLHDGHLPLWDSRYYDMSARRVAHGEGFSDQAYFMSPLYPYWLSLIYRVAAAEPLPESGPPAVAYGAEQRWATLLQGLGGALSCVLIVWIARRLAGAPAGWIAGIVAALYGPFVYQESLLMASQLTLLLNLAALVAVMLARDRGTAPAWLAAGCLLGLCVLAHGSALPLVPGAALLAFFPPASAVPQHRHRWVPAAAVLGGAALMILPATARNLVVAGDPALVTTNAGLTLFIGNHEQATGSYALLPDELRAVPGATLGWYVSEAPFPDDFSGSRVSKRLMGQAIEFVREHPGDALRLGWTKLRLLYGAREVGSRDSLDFARRLSGSLHLAWFGFAWVAPLGLAGLLASLFLRRAPDLAVIQLWIAAQTFVFLATFVLARYRLVLAALLIVLGASALCWIWADLRARRWKPFGVTLATIVLAALVVSAPVDGFDRERGQGELGRQLGERYLAAGRVDDAVRELEQACEGDFRPWDHRIQRLICLGGLVEAHARAGSFERAREVAREFSVEMRKERSDMRTDGAAARIRRALTRRAP